MATAARSRVSRFGLTVALGADGHRRYAAKAGPVFPLRDDDDPNPVLHGHALEVRIIDRSGRVTLRQNRPERWEVDFPPEVPEDVILAAIRCALAERVTL